MDQEKWDQLRNKIKKGISEAKIKVEDFITEKEIPEKLGIDKSKKTVNDVSVKNEIPLEMQELKCSLCGAPIPKELLKEIYTGSSIICEYCGTSIKKDNLS